MSNDLNGEADVSTTHAEVTTPRIAGAVDVVDRFFPLGWVAFYLLLPVSGWAPLMFASWFDQKRDLSTLNAVLAHGRADAIADNGIGPAYIAVAALLHDALGLSPENALVALTRGSYALSVVAGMILVRALVRRLVATPGLVSLAAQIVFVAFVFAAGTWHWSDVPWSHFFAMCLAAGLFALRFAPERFRPAHAGAAGVLLALLALSRTFELAALVVAFGFAALLLAALRLRGPRIWTPLHVVAGAVAFTVTTALVYLETGKRDLFILYGNNLDEQSGNVVAAEVAHTPTFSFALVPHKLVQLFVEPCYYAMCSLADYAGGARPLPPALAEAAGNERLWRLPLAIQLPSLALLPLCIVVVAALVVWMARHRSAAAGRERSLRLLVELTTAATVLVLGYTASTMTGSPHLRYGFARDYLLPALLVTIVAVALASAGLWLLLTRRSKRAISGESIFVVLAIAGSVAMVAGAAYARANGIPRLEGRQLGPISYLAHCDASQCVVSLDAATPAGEPVGIPGASVLTFGCASDKARFSVYVAHLAEPVRMPADCAAPRLVAAWPTVMGLPPGSFELAAVSVENA